MATTTNYGFEIPDDTDLVKDGALAMRDLGQDVDTQLFTALGGNYPGLRLIKKQTIGSAVSSVNVTGAFSATYNAYKIIIAGGGVGSTGANITLKLGASATGYSMGGVFVDYTGSSANIASSNVSSWQTIGFTNATLLSLNCELVDPGVASYTKMTASRIATDSATQTGGVHAVATAFTDFTIAPSSGTITGGTIYVYGYGAS
jgi:hypothetical protein